MNKARYKLHRLYPIGSLRECLNEYQKLKLDGYNVDIRWYERKHNKGWAILIKSSELYVYG